MYSKLLTDTAVRRDVRRLSHRCMQGLVVDLVPRMAMHSSRRLLPSFFRNLTNFMNLHMCARITINLDRLIVLSKSILLGWFLHVSLILIIKGRYPREVSLIVIIKQVSA